MLISCQKAVTALSVNPLVPHQVAIGCSDSTVRTYDRRMLGTRDPGNIFLRSNLHCDSKNFVLVMKCFVLDDFWLWKPKYFNPVYYAENGESAWPTSIFSVPEFEGNSYRITSLSYSPDGQDVLVSYSSDHLYLFSIKVNRNSVQWKTQLYSADFFFFRYFNVFLLCKY